MITEFLLLRLPNSITAGPDGALWFTESGKIGRITTAGMITEFLLPTADSGPNSITQGPDGALWFTESHKIGRITTAGAITEFPMPTTACTEFLFPGSPIGIVAGPDGALWFTETTGCSFPNNIGRITTTGIFTAEFFLIGGSSTSLGPPGIGPIAAGPDDALWFTVSNIFVGVIERLAVTVNTHDFNGDGFSDIAWRDTSGNTAVWLMDGAQVIQSAGVGAARTVWTICRAARFRRRR